MTTFSVNAEIVDEILNRLVNGLAPERIYLFGSQAKNLATDESDIDLLVVVAESDQTRHLRESRSYDLLWGLTTPVDVIVLTQDEFEKFAQVKTSLVARTVATGKLLNGRP